MRDHAASAWHLETWFGVFRFPLFPLRPFIPLVVGRFDRFRIDRTWHHDDCPWAAILEARKQARQAGAEEAH